MSNQFFTNSTPESHEIEEKSENTVLTSRFIEHLSDENIEKFFDVSSTIEWIKNNGYMRIALQFPDSFLPSAEKISKILEKETDVKTFVLADTSYRSCCIDEVAAAHATCDALIHYGEACLSTPTKNIAVKYVLGQMPIDLNHAKSEISTKSSEFCTENVIVVTDSVYSYEQENLTKIVKDVVLNKNVELAKLLEIDQIGIEKSYLGRSVPEALNSQTPCDLLFIGSPESPLLPLWLLSFPNCVTVTHYDPTQSTGISSEKTRSSRLLRKRLFLVEKLKDANTVGLVVGSVGVDKHQEAVRRMRELCKSAGKKIYVISVGKINVPKLSNFSSDIDVFVLLSCPFGVLLDCSDFYRPVLSFFEAEIALNPSRSTWAADGGWSAEFGKFLEDEICEQSEEQQAGDFSLISGKVRAQQKEVEDDGTIKSVAVYTAGDYFKQRAWKGLDDSVQTSTENDLKIGEGRSGIAQGYEGK